MSSFLQHQQSLFKNALSSASSKISNKKTIGPPAGSGSASANATLAPPSPSPSVGSTTSKNDAAAAAAAAGGAGTPTAAGSKRKRNDIVYSQPENTGSGGELGTQLHFALTYLREKNEIKTLYEVMSHLSLLAKDETYKEMFVEALRRHPRIEFSPDESVTEQKWPVGSYRYRPAIPGVRDKASLMKFLAERRDSSGVLVKDLKDGWADCEPALAELEREHKVLVIRTKKEGNPKHVFLDDPALVGSSADMDVEFKNAWMRVQVPKADELPRKLAAVGQKPASDDPALGAGKLPTKQKQQKKRARKMGKVTNTHMQDILRDFSGVKK